jgi:hypothetical protein
MRCPPSQEGSEPRSEIEGTTGPLGRPLRHLSHQHGSTANSLRLFVSSLDGHRQYGSTSTIPTTPIPRGRRPAAESNARALAVGAGRTGPARGNVLLAQTSRCGLTRGLTRDDRHRTLCPICAPSPRPRHRSPIPRAFRLKSDPKSSSMAPARTAPDVTTTRHRAQVGPGDGNDRGERDCRRITRLDDIGMVDPAVRCRQRVIDA